MVKWKGSTVDPVKLQDAKIHKDPPGLSGNLLEGRIYHDAFRHRRQGGRHLCGRRRLRRDRRAHHHRGEQQSRHRKRHRRRGR